MKFREWSEQYLVERGVWPHDAPAIVSEYAASPESEAMAGVWSESIEGYPASMRAVIALMLNRTALKWIDANCPMAWYRPMFAEPAPSAPPREAKP